MKKVNKLVNPLCNALKILCVGIIIGQFWQPLPVQWKSGLPSTAWSDGTGYSDGDLEQMDELVRGKLQ